MNIISFVSNLLDPIGPNVENPGNAKHKKRWVLSKDHQMIKMAHFHSSQTQKIEKIFSKLNNQLEKFVDQEKSFTQFEKNQLQNLLIKVNEYAWKYQQSHGKIYLYISKLLFGDIRKKKEEIEKNIQLLLKKPLSGEGPNPRSFDNKELIDIQKSYLSSAVNFEQPATLQQLHSKSAEELKNLSHEKPLGPNPFDLLPDEIMPLILKHLNLKDLEKLSILNKNIHNRINGQRIKVPLLKSIVERQDISPFQCIYFKLEVDLKLKTDSTDINDIFYKTLSDINDIFYKTLSESEFTQNQLILLLKLAKKIQVTCLNLTNQIHFNNEDLAFLPETLKALELGKSKVTSLEFLNKNIHLTELTLDQCSWFLDEGYRYFPQTLKILRLKSIENLSEISSLPLGLTELSLDDLVDLKNISEGIDQKIESLYLRGSFQLTQLPKSLLESIKILTIDHPLKEFPYSLEDLRISYDPEIYSLEIDRLSLPSTLTRLILSFQNSYNLTTEKLKKIIQPCKDLKSLTIFSGLLTKDFFSVLPSSLKNLSVDQMVYFNHNSIEMMETDIQKSHEDLKQAAQGYGWKIDGNMISSYSFIRMEDKTISETIQSAHESLENFNRTTEEFKIAIEEFKIAKGDFSKIEEDFKKLQRILGYKDS
jgi:hypothetical protein